MLDTRRDDFRCRGAMQGMFCGALPPVIRSAFRLLIFNEIRLIPVPLRSGSMAFSNASRRKDISGSGAVASGVDSCESPKETAEFFCSVEVEFFCESLEGRIFGRQR